MQKHEQIRLARWRAKFLEHALESENVALTCRHFGISRQIFYKWRARYEEHGEAGLLDHSKAPKSCPRATAPEVVSKILYLRQNYHFGCGRIASYLKRYHQISIASSSVQRILVKHNMNRLPANQKHREHKKRWKRYEKQQPGHRLQVDLKFLECIPGSKKRLYQYTAIDDRLCEKT